MTSAVRICLKSFTDPGDQTNLVCYAIRHPIPLREMLAATTENSRRPLQNCEEWNRMLNVCRVYEIILKQCPMSDVRTMKGSADVTPNG